MIFLKYIIFGQIKKDINFINLLKMTVYNCENDNGNVNLVIILIKI